MSAASPSLVSIPVVDVRDGGPVRHAAERRARARALRDACVAGLPLAMRLWRRTRTPWLRPYDLALNAMRTWPVRFCPPDHLLREVFETCRDFGTAKRRLETVPVARPVIFTLIGCARGERCVIERTEEAF